MFSEALYELSQTSLCRILPFVFFSHCCQPPLFTVQKRQFHLWGMINRQILGSSTTQDRSTMHPEFNLNGVRTYDLQIMTVHFMSPNNQAMSDFSDQKDGWMNGVLGHFYALSRLNWAGDSLG